MNLEETSTATELNESNTQVVQEQQNADIANATNLANLISALDKERTARKELEKNLKEQQKRESELTANLDKYKSIDPIKYEKLVAAQKKQDEEALLKRQEFEKVREQYRMETEVAKQESADWKTRYESVVVQTAITTAFYDCGGRKSSFDLSAEGLKDIAPVEAILALIEPALKFEDGKIIILDSIGNIELNKEGRPKTLPEKMLELKKGSMGSLFEPENKNAGTGMIPNTSYKGKSVKLYTLDQARSGKASIDEIASGKAIIN